MSLESLYQEIILEHSKQRSGEHLVEVPAGHASADNHQYNPTCGDEINLRVVLSDELKDGEKEYGDMAAFSGVSKFMARVKCAMLSWVAVEEATKEAAAKS